MRPAALTPPAFLPAAFLGPEADAPSFHAAGGALPKAGRRKHDMESSTGEKEEEEEEEVPEESCRPTKGRFVQTDLHGFGVGGLGVRLQQNFLIRV